MVAFLGAAPALAVAVVVVFGPGLLIGFGLRLRGVGLWALAPVISTSVVGALALVYGASGVPWSLLTVATGCVAVALVAWVSRLLLRDPGARMPRDPQGRTLLLAGLAVGIAVGAVRFALYLGEPGAISQTNDAVFHLGAIRWILETGDASSLHVSAMVGGGGFYPAAWHGLTSVVTLASGADIPTSANMVSFLVAYGVWPLGITWLTVAATRSRATAALSAALSSALLAFPLLMLEWGVLYPYSLSVALLPAAVGVVIASKDWIGGDGPVVGRSGNVVLSGVLIATAVGALALAQPATLLAWGLLVSAWHTGSSVEHARRAVGGARTATIALAIVPWLLLAGLWLALSSGTSGSHWDPFRSEWQAVLDVIINSHMWLPPAIGVSILAVVGIAFAVRSRRLRWLAWGWIALSVLYIGAASIDHEFVRTWVLGAWYSDPYRLAALAPVMVIPLAAVGASGIAAWTARVLSGRAGRENVGSAWAIGAIATTGMATIVVAPVLMMPNVYENGWDRQSRYESNALSYLSPDERLLLQRLAVTVPADGTVIANPSTGGAFGYMLSGRNVYPRTWRSPDGPAWATVATGLNQAAADPAVCTALADLGSPRYVLDFGPGEASPGRSVMPGMTGFAGRPGFDKVDEQGDASLWRITACTP